MSRMGAGRSTTTQATPAIPPDPGARHRDEGAAGESGPVAPAAPLSPAAPLPIAQVLAEWAAQWLWYLRCKHGEDWRIWQDTGPLGTWHARRRSGDGFRQGDQPGDPRYALDDGLPDGLAGQLAVQAGTPVADSALIP